MPDLRPAFNAVLRQLNRIGGRDSEREQASIRVAIGALLLGYYASVPLYTQRPIRMPDPGCLLLLFLLTVFLLLHVLTHAGVKPWRRLAGAVLDVFAVTYFFFTSDAAAVPMYALYLWIIFGNGFRYGQRYLYFSLVLSLIGFGMAMARLPQWQSHASLALGLWVGMLAVSLYVSHLAGRLRTALQVAEAANMAKRRFVSSVSHELRTPLNAIIGMGALLKTTQLDREQQDMLTSMEDASRLMLSLIADVLDFSKIEAGKVSMEAKPFDLHALMESTTGLLRYQAQGKGLNLHYQLATGTPEMLVGDQHHLKQIVVNLLSNAIKFTDRGEVGCKVALLRHDTQRVWLRFEVSDTGIGIAPEAQLRIFESFAQADDSTTRRYGGTGLGTTIAKQLVELMGGRINVISALGKGSLFWFEVPFSIANASLEPCARGMSSANQASVPVALASSAQSFLRVLVAEDNPTNAMLLKRVLERAGHGYELVSDGEQALDRIATGRFDVALFDMNMPVLSGLDAIKAYRFMVPHGRHVPVAMFSADASLDTREECMRAGVDAYLTKPIQPAELLNTLAELTGTVPRAWSEVTAPRPVEVSGTSPSSSADTSVREAASKHEPQLDLSALRDLEALGGSPDFVQALIEGYIEDNRKLVERLQAGVERQRLQECREVLHAMRGSAVSIGAIGMRRFCEDIERMNPQELFRLRRSIVERCNSVFLALCIELEQWCKLHETRTENDGSGRSAAGGT
jgi:two-component system, sensor histidine kinase RpfC